MSDAPIHAEIVGDPVHHLRTPQVQQYWLDAAGIDGRFTARRVARAEFDSYLADSRADPLWMGCTVAAPLKLDALLRADEPTDRAAAAGAANLLARRDGRLVAGNTDVGAAVAVLGPLLKRSAERGVTLLGDGGAARAILVALKILGAIPAVRLQSRDRAAAIKLSVEFGLDHGPAPFDTPIGSSGLINATPLGRADHPPVALDLAAMPGQGWVLDLVATGGGPTALLADAAARGLHTVDGIDLLVEQCAASFELLFGSSPPRGDDARLLAMLRA